jgi:hypothetical protein
MTAPHEACDIPNGRRMSPRDGSHRIDDHEGGAGAARSHAASADRCDVGQGHRVRRDGPDSYHEATAVSRCQRTEVPAGLRSVQGPARDIHHPAGKRSQTETLCTAAPDWLVTRIANEAIDPDWTSPGLARFVILSGAARIRTTAVEWWSRVAGSGPEAVTAAVSVTTPGCPASTRAITVTVAPEAMSPKEHRSDGSSVQLPWLGFSDRMGFFPLDATVLTTWTAASGPRLVTVDRDGVGEHVAHGRHLRRNGLGDHKLGVARYTRRARADLP